MLLAPFKFQKKKIKKMSIRLFKSLKKYLYVLAFFSGGQLFTLFEMYLWYTYCITNSINEK